MRRDRQNLGGVSCTCLSLPIPIKYIQSPAQPDGIRSLTASAVSGISTVTQMWERKRLTYQQSFLTTWKTPPVSRRHDVAGTTQGIFPTDKTLSV